MGEERKGAEKAGAEPAVLILVLWVFLWTHHSTMGNDAKDTKTHVFPNTAQLGIDTEGPNWCTGSEMQRRQQAPVAIYDEFVCCTGSNRQPCNVRCVPIFLHNCTLGRKQQARLVW